MSMKPLLHTAAAFAAFALSASAFAAAHKEAPNMAASGAMAKTAASAPMAKPATMATPAAASASKPMSAQQSKMGTCNSEAGDKKGDDRKAFMKQCLSGQKMSQQDKMKKCNVDATGKKGDERKTFMKECLSA